MVGSLGWGDKSGEEWKAMMGDFTLSRNRPNRLVSDNSVWEAPSWEFNNSLADDIHYGLSL